MSRTGRLDDVILGLVRLNQRLDTPLVRRLLALGVWIGSMAALTWAADRAVGLNSPPPIIGDALSYDAIGWELAQGRGFSMNLSDPDLLQPYAEIDPVAAEQFATASTRGPIASRPPLLPLLMSGLNRMFGRQFWAIRVVNCAFLATVAALIAWTVCRLAGPLPALLGVFQFLIVDPRVRVASREILTESLACLLISALTMLLVRLSNRPRILTAALAGAVFGCAILVRTMFALWLPVLVVAVWWTNRSLGMTATNAAVLQTDPRNLANRTTLFRVQLVVGFLVATTIVFASWGVRNYRVLGRMMPLGTQGSMELSAGYSDAAFARWGMWHNLDEAGFFTSIDSGTNSPLQREVAHAEFSSQQAVTWCRSHPVQTAVLPLMKVFQEFRPHTSGDLYVLAFALLGLAAVRGTPEGRVWGVVLLATALGVAVTWSVAGRFIVPMLYVLHCAAAIGVWRSLIACTARATSYNSLSANRQPTTDH